MNDDLTLLASTYLDGEATPDERARVEADPALLAEVERLRDGARHAARRQVVRTPRRRRTRGRHRGGPRRVGRRRRADLPGVRHRATAGPVGRSHVGRSNGARTYTRWLSAAAALVAVAGARCGRRPVRRRWQRRRHRAAIEARGRHRSARAESARRVQTEQSGAAGRRRRRARQQRTTRADDAGGADAGVRRRGRGGAESRRRARSAGRHRGGRRHRADAAPQAILHDA